MTGLNVIQDVLIIDYECNQKSVDKLTFLLQLLAYLENPRTTKEITSKFGIRRETFSRTLNKNPKLIKKIEGTKTYQRSF